MKKLIFVILILSLLAWFGTVSAEQNWYCDPIPADLADLPEGTPEDCIVLTAPDGSTHVYLIGEYGCSLDAYRRNSGEWELIVSGGEALQDFGNARFVRHQADQLRPDGTPCGDDQGFDVVCENGTSDSYHWDGEYYSLCGWVDPNRYSGQVMIQGTVLRYFPGGSTAPEYETDTGDGQTLYFWTCFYQERPASPEDAKKRTAILPASIRDDIPGMELVEYVSYNSGTEAETVFAAVTENSGGCTLHTVKGLYDTESENPKMTKQTDVPLSESLKGIPVKTLWQDAYQLLTQPGALDSARLPVNGRVVDYSIQAGQLVLLTEDDRSERRIVIAEEDATGVYSLRETNVLPANTALDTFHAGENEIQAEFSEQEWCAGFTKTSSAWKLAWVMGEGPDYMNYSLHWYGVTYTGVSETDGEDLEGRLIGSMEGSDLLTTDFVSIPRNLETLKRAVNREGWAVVSNPKPEERLHLRPEAGNRDVSLGKFYNGTPVRVLETDGDWCRVQIGISGPEGWMMKKYLAFEDRMDSVEPAYPALELKEVYRDKAGWTDPQLTTQEERLLKEASWDIVGFLEDTYILLSNDGECVYARMAWFGEGNG